MSARDMTAEYAVVRKLCNGYEAELAALRTTLAQVTAERDAALARLSVYQRRKEVRQ